jgi:hypothetical protein
MTDEYYPGKWYLERDDFNDRQSMLDVTRDVIIGAIIERDFSYKLIAYLISLLPEQEVYVDPTAVYEFAKTHALKSVKAGKISTMTIVDVDNKNEA